MGNTGKKEKATKKEKTSFSKGLQVEFKKITWPDRESLIKQSAAVICVSVVLGVVIAILDLIMQYGVTLLTM